MDERSDLERLQEGAKAEFDGVLDELREDHPKAVEGAAVAVGATLGASASFTVLYFAGTVGLSASGITTGLAAAGTVVGSGMVVGIGVLAAPVAVLSVGFYAYAKRRRNAKLAAALRTAIEKLHRIHERLAANAEYFKKELAEIKAYIDQFETQMP